MMGFSGGVDEEQSAKREAQERTEVNARGSLRIN